MKEFKVLIKKGNDIFLTEVLGYYFYLESYKMFLHFNIYKSCWNVVDTQTGLCVAKGRTMAEAKGNIKELIVKYKRKRQTSEYNDYCIRYKKLLKEALWLEE